MALMDTVVPLVTGKGFWMRGINELKNKGLALQNFNGF